MNPLIRTQHLTKQRNHLRSEIGYLETEMRTIGEAVSGRNNERLGRLRQKITRKNQAVDLVNKQLRQLQQSFS